MCGRETRVGRRRRALVVLGALSLVSVVVIGAAATTPVETQTATPIQNDTNAGQPASDSVDGEGAPPTSPAENESAFPSAGANDTPSTEQPQAALETDPQILQGPEGNVTVDAAENQSIRAGTVGSVDLEVTNDGDQRATDIVVTLRAADGAVAFGTADATQPTRSLAVGDLSPGDTETVDINIAATRAEPGTYPLFASVQYRTPSESTVGDGDSNETTDSANEDADRIVQTGGPSTLEINITDAASFDITPVDDDVPIDEESVYEVRVENDGTQTATGVTAIIEAGPPLSSESPTAYIGTLEPGESETVRFSLESSSDAVETTTSVVLSVSYDAGSGERSNADPVQLPVTIVEADEDTEIDSVAPFAVVAVVFALAAIWWFRRR